jgi:hypothetical protein
MYSISHNPGWWVRTVQLLYFTVVAQAIVHRGAKEMSKTRVYLCLSLPYQEYIYAVLEFLYFTKMASHNQSIRDDMIGLAEVI